MDDTQNDNARTLESYQAHTQQYVDGTPPIDEAIRQWVDASLELIPPDGKILEVGSGYGRVSEYIREKGFAIECSDAVPNFVDILTKKGFNARYLDLLKDEIEHGYDAIIADAVLLHFTPNECRRVLVKIHDALQVHGILALRMKQGDGPVWTTEKLGSPRYFYYWNKQDFKHLLIDQGFEWLSVDESYTSHNKASWMHIVVRRV